MTPIAWAILPLRRYAQFSGRARRREYWFFILLCVAATLAASVIDGLLDMSGLVAGRYGPVTFLVSLVLLVPGIAVGIRRLHDTGRSGWWLLVCLVPYGASVPVLMAGSIMLAGLLSLAALAGGLVLLTFMILEGTEGPNQYGPDPTANVAETDGPG